MLEAVQDYGRHRGFVTTGRTLVNWCSIRLIIDSTQYRILKAPYLLGAWEYVPISKKT